MSQIYIKLTVLSKNNSIKKLVLLDLEYPINKTSDKFKEIYEQAIELEGAFKTIIYQVDKKTTDMKNVSSISIAEEVEKLHILLTKGILTDEEFKIQKEKILSK